MKAQKDDAHKSRGGNIILGECAHKSRSLASLATFPSGGRSRYNQHFAHKQRQDFTAETRNFSTIKRHFAPKRYRIVSYKHLTFQPLNTPYKSADEARSNMNGDKIHRRKLDATHHSTRRLSKNTEQYDTARSSASTHQTVQHVT